MRKYENEATAATTTIIKSIAPRTSEIPLLDLLGSIGLSWNYGVTRNITVLHSNYIEFYIVFHNQSL